MNSNSINNNTINININISQSRGLYTERPVSFGVSENEPLEEIYANPNSRCFDIRINNEDILQLERKKTAEFQSPQYHKKDLLDNQLYKEERRILDETSNNKEIVPLTVSPTFGASLFKSEERIDHFPPQLDLDSPNQVNITSNDIYEEEFRSEDDNDEEEYLPSFYNESKVGAKSNSRVVESKVPGSSGSQNNYSKHSGFDREHRKTSIKVDSSPIETSSIHDRMQSPTHVEKDNLGDGVKNSNIVNSTINLVTVEQNPFYSSPDLIQKNNRKGRELKKNKKKYDELRVEIEESDRKDSHDGTEDYGKSQYSDMSEMKESPFQRASPSRFRSDTKKFQLNLIGKLIKAPENKSPRDINHFELDPREKEAIKSVKKKRSEMEQKPAPTQVKALSSYETNRINIGRVGPISLVVITVIILIIEIIQTNTQ